MSSINERPSGPSGKASEHYRCQFALVYPGFCDPRYSDIDAMLICISLLQAFCNKSTLDSGQACSGLKLDFTTAPTAADARWCRRIVRTSGNAAGRPFSPTPKGPRIGFFAFQMQFSHFYAKRCTTTLHFSFFVRSADMKKTANSHRKKWVEKVPSVLPLRTTFLLLSSTRHRV